ncbi:MAG: glycosyltransferase family 4 protein [Candidatus Omnitrophota bacterium]
MNIAVLSPYCPAVDTTACARKVFDCIALLRARGHKIYLLSFCSRPDKPRIARLKPYCEAFYLAHITNYYRYPRGSLLLTNTISALCANNTVDILQCENSFMARYIPENINTPLVLTEHEVLSESFYQRIGFEKNVFRKCVLSLRTLKKLKEQKIWYAKFNKIIVFTRSDREILLKLYGLKQIEVIPLGINLKEYAPPEKKDSLADIIFTANFSHLPNVDAALFFYKCVLPLLRNKIPDIRMIFAGASPPGEVKRLAALDRNVTVTGYVEDIKAAYAQAKLAVVPVRYGTGMCYKTLEAIALGVPVVSTSVGARGIDHQGNIKVADSAENFAAAAADLLSNKAAREKTGEMAKYILEKEHDWVTLLTRYEKIYFDLLKKAKTKTAKKTVF